MLCQTEKDDDGDYQTELDEEKVGEDCGQTKVEGGDEPVDPSTLNSSD